MQFNGINSSSYLGRRVIMYDDDKGSPPPYVEPLSIIGAGYAYSAITELLRGMTVWIMGKPWDCHHMEKKIPIFLN